MEIPMRTVIAVLMLSLSAPGLQLAPDARIAQVSDGKVDQNSYFNDAFEISFRARASWTIALTPKGTVQFSPESSAEDPVNRCSRALFSSEPAVSKKRQFGPKVTYFLFDPECFPGEPFPKSTKDAKAVGVFALRVVNALASTPYSPPGGADFSAYDAGKHAFVTLATQQNVDVPDAVTTSPHKVHVNILLTLTESNNYWVVMSEMLDDEAKKTMGTGWADMNVRP
jgi:hypothetical protein